MTTSRHEGLAWLVCVLLGALLGQLLRVDLLTLPRIPAGGDTPSHAWHAWLWLHEAWRQGRLSTWMPEAFAGFPLMSYYFPLPFVTVAVLEPVLGFAPAFKLAICLPVVLLPAAIFGSSRHLLGLARAPSLCAAATPLALLLQESNSLWGGNLLSLLSGEFAYSWGLTLLVPAWCQFLRAADRGGLRNWLLAGVLEAAVGLCHGYALLALGFSTAVLVMCTRRPLATAGALAATHALAFVLLGGWLWPLLDMHGLTIANDSSNLFLPASVLMPAPWLLAMGAAALAAALPMLLRWRGAAAPPQAPAAAAPASVAASLVVALLALTAERTGLLDIRFVPLAWLLSLLAAGWVVGSALQRLPPPVQAPALGALLLAWLATLAPGVQQAPVWAAWNHLGLDAKPRWQQVQALVPALRGDWRSPRLLFEHDPLNADLGSTRALEALPLWLGGRPVLEGLYMESALLAPAVYLLQSEVSARPSSPLVRHPAAELDPERAAAHMRLMWANQVLVRSDTAREALSRSPQFRVAAQAPPFTLFELTDFDAPLIDARPRRWVDVDPAERVRDVDRWLRLPPGTESPWPVYRPPRREPPCAGPAPTDARAPAASAIDRLRGSPGVSQLVWERERLHFQTTHIGVPHLVRMAYHPRWQLRTRGRVDVAAPGFLLLTPCEAQVDLAYDPTPVMRAGQAASALAIVLVLVLWAAVGRRGAAASRPASGLQLSATRSAGGLLVLLAAGALAWQQAPGRHYEAGWQAWRQDRFDAAARAFEAAAALRAGAAPRAEAHFWAAKSWERHKAWDAALSNYAVLTADPSSPWAAESLFNAAQVLRVQGRVDAARALESRLRADFPRSPWGARLAAAAAAASAPLTMP